MTGQIHPRAVGADAPKAVLPGLGAELLDVPGGGGGSQKSMVDVRRELRGRERLLVHDGRQAWSRLVEPSIVERRGSPRLILRPVSALHSAHMIFHVSSRAPPRCSPTVLCRGFPGENESSRS